MVGSPSSLQLRRVSCRSGGFSALSRGLSERSVLAILPTGGPLNPCQRRGQAQLRVYMCLAAPLSAVVLRSQTGLHGELARLQDQGTGGMAPLATLRQRWSCGAASVSAVTLGPTRAGRRRGPAGPKSGRPGGRGACQGP